MAILPVDRVVQIELFVETLLAAILLIISLPWLMFVKEANTKFVLTRLLLGNVIVAGVLIVYDLLEVFSVDVKTRDGDNTSVAWGRWAAYLITTPVVLTQTAIFLHHTFTWKMALLALGFGFELLRLIGTLTSDIGGRWVCLGAQIFIGAMIIWIVIHKSQKSAGAITFVSIFGFIFGAINITAFSLDPSQYAILNWEWVTGINIVTNFFIHFVWPLSIIHFYEKPALNILTNPKTFGFFRNWFAAYKAIVSQEHKQKTDKSEKEALFDLENAVNDNDDDEDDEGRITISKDEAKLLKQAKARAASRQTMNPPLDSTPTKEG